MTEDYQRTVTFNAGVPTRVQSEAAHFGRWALIIGGGAACIMLNLVSGYFQIRFAQRLGTDWHETVAWTVFAIGANIFNSVLPIAWGEARRRGETMWAYGCAAAWAMAFTWAIISSFGFAVSTRDLHAAQTSAKIEDRADSRAAITQMRAQLEALGRVRPLEAVDADLTAEYRKRGIEPEQRRCSTTTDWAQRHCARIWSLGAEREKAASAEKLTASIAQERDRIAGAPVLGSNGDPQTDALAWVTGFSQSVVSWLISLFVALMLELFAAFGPALVFNGARAMRETLEEAPVPETVMATMEPTIGSLHDGFNRWAGEFLEIDAAARTTAQEAYRHYAGWAVFNRVDAGTNVSFGKLLAPFAAAMGASAGRDASTAHYTGLALRKNEPVKMLRAAQ